MRSFGVVVCQYCDKRITAMAGRESSWVHTDTADERCDTIATPKISVGIYDKNSSQYNPHPYWG